MFAVILVFPSLDFLAVQIVNGVFPDEPAVEFVFEPAGVFIVLVESCHRGCRPVLAVDISLAAFHIAFRVGVAQQGALPAAVEFRIVI